MIEEYWAGTEFEIDVLRSRLIFANRREQMWRDRLMVDGGEPHFKDCCDYSDGLVIKGRSRFGQLTRLEWMLRVAVGHARRQDAYIEKLEQESDCEN